MVLRLLMAGSVSLLASYSNRLPSRRNRSLFNAGQIEEKHIREGGLTMTAVTAARAAVTGLHIGFEQHAVIVGL